MSAVEVSRPSLAECEAVIEAGIQTFIEVGEALAAIRDNELYRSSHETFEDYCRERWGFHRQHAWRLIEASEIVGMLPASPIGDAPANEAQVRELAPLKENPGEMAAAWNAAKRRAEDDNRRLTARDVRDEVQPRVSKSPEGGEAWEESPSSAGAPAGSSPATEDPPSGENTKQGAGDDGSVSDGDADRPSHRGTGQRTEPEPAPDPEVDRKVREVMDGSRDDPDEVSRQKLGRKAAQLHDQYGSGLLALDPQRVAQTVEPEERIVWRATAEQSAKWWSDLLAALGEGQGLRVVEGGKS